MDQLELFPEAAVSRDGDSNVLCNVTRVSMDSAEFHGPNRNSGDVIDIVDRLALRLWYRRFWPKPQNPCKEPINLSRRGVA